MLVAIVLRHASSCVHPIDLQPKTQVHHMPYIISINCPPSSPYGPHKPNSSPPCLSCRWGLSPYVNGCNLSAISALAAAAEAAASARAAVAQLAAAAAAAADAQRALSRCAVLTFCSHTLHALFSPSAHHVCLPKLFRTI